MYERIMKELKTPELYQKTEGAFWDDEHISEQMLKARLDPSLALRPPTEPQHS